jgi:hypothetical protein
LLLVARALRSDRSDTVNSQNHSSNNSQNTDAKDNAATKQPAHVEVQPIKKEDAAVDFGSDQSFPASDPPANTPIKRKDDDQNG